MWQAKIYDMYFRALFSAFSNSSTANVVRPIIFKRLWVYPNIFIFPRSIEAGIAAYWRQTTTMAAPTF